MDVVGEIGADGVGGDGEARGPLGDELVDVGEACVAAGGKVLCYAHGEGWVVKESIGADGPDGGDPGEAGEFTPELSEVEPEEIGEGRVDGGLVFAREERRVSNEESGVAGGEHGRGIGGLLDVGGMGLVEVLEEDARVGGRAARGGVGGEGADALERSGGGEVIGVFDEQENAADLMQGSDVAARDDGELRCERGDGDEAEVGGAGDELGCAG